MKYFTIEELVKSDTARKYNIDNTPSLTVRRNLTLLVNNVLDPARVALGKPISVNCGYRSKPVNILVHGSSSSQHVTGEAADIESENNLELARVIFNLGVFDQLILEYPDARGIPAWVHVSFSSVGKNRKQVLYCRKNRAGEVEYLPYRFL